MNQVSYNLILIVLAIISTFVCGFVLPTEYNKITEKGQPFVCIICIITAIAVLGLIFCSLDFTGKACQLGLISEINNRGSYGGFYDTYEIVITDKFGKTHTFRSIFPMNTIYTKYMNDFAIGDTVNIYGSTLIDSFFYKLEKA